MKIFLLRWLICWADLLSGLLGVLSLGLLTLDDLQLKTQDLYLKMVEAKLRSP